MDEDLPDSGRYIVKGPGIAVIYPGSLAWVKEAFRRAQDYSRRRESMVTVEVHRKGERTRVIRVFDNGKDVTE